MIERTCVYHDKHQRPRCSECGLLIDDCTCPDADNAAHDRLWSEDGKMIRAIRGELSQIRSANPNNYQTLAQLQAEVGQLALALIEQGKSGVTVTQVFIESIQVAAMAIRVGTEGDDNFHYEPYSIFKDES